MRKSIFEAIDGADKDGIAIEAMIQAEHQFLCGDFTKDEIEEMYQEDVGFQQMAYKDDDGYWRVTGYNGKYATHELLMKAFPDIC